MATPKLTIGIIEDEAALAARIDQLLGPDPRYCNHVRAIRHAQDALRCVLADREWASYLDLHAAETERFAYELLVAVRWAFEQGQRNALPRGQ